MARRCTTVPGYGTCCAVAQAGQLGQPRPVTLSNGKVRCVQCDVVTKRNGSQGFRMRFHKNVQCGIGPSGCPALGTGTQGTLALQSRF